MRAVSYTAFDALIVMKGVSSGADQACPIGCIAGDIWATSVAVLNVAGVAIHASFWEEGRA